MNAAAIFTKRVMGIDYRVWLVMPVIWILSFALLGYKYVNDKPCAPATINIDGKPSEEITVRSVNQLMEFAIQTEGAKDVQWNYKDGTDQGLVVYHKFTKEGEYNVVATVNGACTYNLKVIVESRNDIDNHEKTEFRIFPYPDKPKYSIGEIINFESEKINILATSYEWKVLETKETQTDPVATFTFNIPGKYTIQLILNNDPSIVETRRIEVFAADPSIPEPIDAVVSNDRGPVDGPLPPLVPHEENSPAGKGTPDSTKNTKEIVNGPTPPKPKAREVDSEAFKTLLQSVVNEEGKEPEDLYEFLDYKGSTMVEVNGDKNGSIPLKDFCKKMIDKRKNKRKIESISFVKDNNNSIQRIQVKVPEKNWWWPF